MSEAVERPPRRDDTAADVGSLVRLGRVEPQPIPEAPATAEPAPEPAPADTSELGTILVGAGMETAADTAALQALAKLDPETIKTVTRWMQADKTKPSK